MYVSAARAAQPPSVVLVDATEVGEGAVVLGAVVLGTVGLGRVVPGVVLVVDPELG